MPYSKHRKEMLSVGKKITNLAWRAVWWVDSVIETLDEA